MSLLIKQFSCFVKHLSVCIQLHTCWVPGLPVILDVFTCGVGLGALVLVVPVSQPIALLSLVVVSRGVGLFGLWWWLALAMRQAGVVGLPSG